MTESTSANTGHLSHWSSPEPDCGKKRYNVGAGLFNPRLWTCFLNCILQCASIGFCCFCSLKLHADESIRLSGSAFYPERFVNHLKSISSNFESGVQQDAQEFFFDLLEKLDEAYVAPRSSEEPSSTEEGGIAKQIFGGRLKSQLRCPECKRCSDKSEPFIDLSLEVTMVESLMDALHSFTKVELIEDFMCDGCNSRVNMEKHFKVEQAPEVLVIHLKRFTNSRGKIWDKVKYPLELDINSFMSSSDDTPQKYDLYGVVVHHGIYGRGHYVCYIRSSVDDWYEFNDDKVCRCFEASVLDSAAYLLFYVKQGSSPWFSTLLEKEDKFPQDGSVSLAEQGTSEFALVNNKDESTFSHGRDNSGYCLFGPAEENGNGSSLPEFSQDIQQNGNGNTLSDSTDKLAEGCCLGGMSGGTQELSCLTGSSDKNGHADGFLEPWEKEDVSLRGSLDTDEINPSTHGSSEIDPTVTEGGSPPKICSLLQVSHKYDDKPWEKEDVSPSGSLDTKEMNPSTHGYSEVDPVVTPGGSPPKGENICSLLQLSHKYDDKSWEKEDVSPRGSLETKEMNPSTHGSSEFDPAVAKGGSSPKGENICSLLQLSHKYDDKSWENVNPRGSLDTKELNPSTQGSSEVDPAVTQGGSPPKSENICSSLQLSHKYGNNCSCRNFSSQENETGAYSGAPPVGMCTSENETVDSKSKSNLEFETADGATRGKCNQL
ncbi:ubiquitin carboxyl-terminal hydrolase 20 [Setaria italica]|uniref:ubiquitin carboxyl-terminal hydrolase 20 n=1 Tax=Setaria italica TaxID=4555 RepID=UPI000BE50013|nr:ubiquitin carboxyl-terminal hydrolase 20 [Setaria italica]